MDRMKRKKERILNRDGFPLFARCAGGNKEIQGRRISSLQWHPLLLWMLLKKYWMFWGSMSVLPPSQVETR